MKKYTHLIIDFTQEGIDSLYKLAIDKVGSEYCSNVEYKKMYGGMIYSFEINGLEPFHPKHQSLMELINYINSMNEQ